MNYFYTDVRIYLTFSLNKCILVIRTSEAFLKITEKHLTAAFMDALGMTSEAVASAIGVDADTVRHWRMDSAYKKAVQAAGDKLRESEIGKAREAMAAVMDVVCEAVKVKVDIMRDDTADARLRNQAATELLKIGMGGTLGEGKSDNDGAVAHLQMDIGTEHDDNATPFFSPDSKPSLHLVSPELTKEAVNA